MIDNNAKIGNFVEVKKSKINNDVKISHLSYIGDSVIEKNTTIGAGTITCNFDGFKKNKTYIGENCFIGSNTSLIASFWWGLGSYFLTGEPLYRSLIEEG